MNLIIEITEPGRSPRRVSVTRSLATIGRSAKCDVRVDADVVSSRHAQLKRYEHRLVIEDLGATNGLLLNGDVVSGTVPVSDGDVIQLGAGGPLIKIVSGAQSFSDRGSDDHRGRHPSRASNARQVTLAISTLVAVMFLLIAGIATFAWLGDARRAGLEISSASSSSEQSESSAQSADHDKLEISSISDPRLSQAVGMVICGGDFDDGDERPLGFGSAFVITADGFLATNKHVVKGFDGDPQDVEAAFHEKIKSASPPESPPELLAAKLAEATKACADLQRPRVWVAIDGKIVDAEVKMVSDNYDLAILKVDRKGLPYFALSTGNIDRLTEVSAIGFPGAAFLVYFSEFERNERLLRSASGTSIKRFFTPTDLDFTQTSGKVSRLKEQDTETGRKIIWVQHTASISEGNSGGPLCLQSGAVVGVNTLGNPLDKNIQLSYAIGQVRNELEAVTGKLHWR